MRSRLPRKMRVFIGIIPLGFLAITATMASWLEARVDRAFWRLSEWVDGGK